MFLHNSNIFDKARKHAEKQYAAETANGSEHAQVLFEHRLKTIDRMEERASESFKERIRYFFKLSWQILYEPYKNAISVILVMLCLFFLVYLSADYTLKESVQYSFLTASGICIFIIIVVTVQILYELICKRTTKHVKSDLKSILILAILSAPFLIYHIENNTTQTNIHYEETTSAEWDNYDELIEEYEDDENNTVYMTPSGEKYHRKNCRYIKKANRVNTMTRKRADWRYDPCYVCRP